MALFNSQELAIASDFTMRVRFNHKMNPAFAWLYFRSVMFQSQIEPESRGLSVPNIFPPQVEKMFVPSCDKSRQDSIAAEIITEIERSDRNEAAIESRRS